jgi:myo-inositol catabolism protein IolC
MAGTLDDAGVVAEVAARYQRLIALWLQSRHTAESHLKETHA